MYYGFGVNKPCICKWIFLGIFWRIIIRNIGYNIYESKRFYEDWLTATIKLIKFIILIGLLVNHLQMCFLFYIRYCQKIKLDRHCNHYVK